MKAVTFAFLFTVALVVVACISEVRSAPSDENLAHDRVRRGSGFQGMIDQVGKFFTKDPATGQSPAQQRANGMYKRFRDATQQVSQQVKQALQSAQQG